MIDIARLDSKQPDFAKALRVLRQPPQEEDTRATVADIIQQVRLEGDAALLRLTQKLDHFGAASAAELLVSAEDLAAASAQLSEDIKRALTDAAARLAEYHRRQLPQSWQYTDAHGNRCGERAAAVSRAAVYAPGGKAAYPSSVLMGIVPAKIAGVEEVILFTPAASGDIPPVTLAAAHLAGADKVIKLGGAQAVAAAALGTETIPRADVIVGPGNSYVAEAKRQLCGAIGIDSFAGPSEVLIICDDVADAEWVAADLLAQAEHDEQAQSIALSPSADFLQQVAEALTRRIEQEPRQAVIRHSLAARGALIVAADMAECCRIADDIAAEHLQVMCAEAETVASKIRHAGGIFVGAYSSVPLGDYGAGPNHVLPTAGSARFASPLGVRHFIKHTGIFCATAAGAKAPAKTAAVLAQIEGLAAHAHAAMLRG